jgi:hypothetical protein
VKLLIHELAHAYHLEQWPANEEDIEEAWKSAMKQRLYHGVTDWWGTKLDKAHAATNAVEYFAELSSMYFAGCEHQPFNRRELKAYDPAGYAMIEKMWGVKSESPEGPAVPAAPCATASVEGRQHVVMVHNGVLRLSTLMKDGSFGEWDPLAQKAGDIGVPSAIACAGIGDELHVLAISGNTLFHGIRFRNGDWQRFADVKPATGDYGNLEGASVACSSDGKTLMVVVTRRNGWVQFTERYSYGQWKTF